MRGKLTWLLLFSAGLAAFYYSRTAEATGASGFVPTTLAVGTFDEINAFNQHTADDLPAGFGGPVWISLQKTKGRSDLYVQSNVFQPGGSTGWHTHPGHSLIIVTSGTLTEYMADCTPHVYAFVPGHPEPTLVDPGDGMVHLIRNEGAVRATNIAVQLVPYDPAKANRRIDAPAPDGCSDIK